MAETGGEPADSGSIDRLYAAQRDPHQRRALTAVGLLVGLVFASAHWSGLLVGGALVGVSQPTLRRAVLVGLGFGVVVVVVAAARFALAGTLAGVLGTWPLVAIGVAVPLVAGPVGATVRGLVANAPPGEGS